jgi:hypothetical protein
MERMSNWSRNTRHDSYFPFYLTVPKNGLYLSKNVAYTFQKHQELCTTHMLVLSVVQKTYVNYTLQAKA